MIESIPELPIPQEAIESLRQMVGDERTEKAVQRAQESQRHWATLARLVDEGGTSGKDGFIAYERTMSRQDLIDTLMVGIVNQKMLLTGFISYMEGRGISMEDFKKEHGID